MIEFTNGDFAISTRTSGVMPTPRISRPLGVLRSPSLTAIFRKQLWFAHNLCLSISNYRCYPVNILTGRNPEGDAIFVWLVCRVFHNSEAYFARKVTISSKHVSLWGVKRPREP